MNKKTPSKKSVGKLNDEDLFGDFKEMDTFIDSESYEVIDKNGQKSGDFEITSKDKKKKAGHAKPPDKSNVEELADEDLFGEFKTLEEFEHSESFEVTKSKGPIKSKSEVVSKKVEKVEIDDDLFGDFKSLEEFEKSDSYEVTKPPFNPTVTSNHTGSTPPSTSKTLSNTSSSEGGIEPVKSQISDPIFALKKSQKADQNKEIDRSKTDQMDPTREKLIAIAEKRKMKKNKGKSDDLFSELDDFDLVDD